jgi:hypothetical protein
MKKSLLLGALIFSLLFTSISQIQLHASNGLTFSVDSIENATQGETITIPIHVSNNPGFNAVGLVLTYNPSVFEITGVTAPIVAMPLNSQFALTSVPGTQWIHLVNTSIVNWNGSGIVANVTFNVRANAAIGSSNIGLAFTNTPDGTPVNAGGNLINNSATVSRSIDIIAGSAEVMFQGIVHPSPIIGLPNGVSATTQSLGLPVSVLINTTGGNRWANVQWNMAGINYNSANPNAQSFIVTGTVLLPQGVTNPNNLSLSTSISVTVNAANINTTPVQTPVPQQTQTPQTVSQQPTLAPVQLPTPTTPTATTTIRPAQPTTPTMPLEPIVHPDPIVLTFMLNGRQTSFRGQPPILTPCGTTLVPVRELFEMIGWSVEWDARTETATMRRGRSVVTVTNGSRQFTAHGITRSHDNESARMVNGHLMVPFVQLFNNSLGARMWRDADNVLHMFYN